MSENRSIWNLAKRVKGGHWAAMSENAATQREIPANKPEILRKQDRLAGALAVKYAKDISTPEAAEAAGKVLISDPAYWDGGEYVWRRASTYFIQMLRKMTADLPAKEQKAILAAGRRGAFGGRAGATEASGRLYWTDPIPVIGHARRWGDNRSISNLAQRVKRWRRIDDPVVNVQREWGEAYLMEYVADQEYWEARGQTIPGQAAETALRMPAFMGELALGYKLIGAAAPALKGVGGAAAGKLAARFPHAAAGVGRVAAVVAPYTQKGALGYATKALGHLARWTGEAAGRTATVSVPAVGAIASERRIPEMWTAGGELQIGEPGATRGEAIAAGAKRMLAENMGAVAFRGLGRLAPGPLRSVLAKGGARLESMYRSVTHAVPGAGPGTKAMREAMKALGFDGIVTEIGEERVVEALNNLFNVDFSLEAWRRVFLPGWERLAVEGLAFSVPGAIGAAPAAVHAGRGIARGPLPPAPAPGAPAQAHYAYLVRAALERGSRRKFQQLCGGELPEQFRTADARKQFLRDLEAIGERATQAEQQAEAARAAEAQPEAAREAAPEAQPEAAPQAAPQAAPPAAPQAAPQQRMAPEAALEAAAQQAQARPAPEAAPQQAQARPAPYEIRTDQQMVDALRAEADAEARTAQAEAMTARPEAPAAPQPDTAGTTPGYGVANRFVTRDQANRASARLATKVRRLHAGVPVDALGDVALLGLYHFEAGARSFAKWAREMAKNAAFQNWSKDSLRLVWDMTALNRRAIVAAERLSRPAQARSGKIMEAVRPLRGDRVSLTPAQLNQYSFMHQARGARAGYAQGRLDAQASVQEIADYAEANLPAAEAGLARRALRMAARTQITPPRREALIESINRMAENYDKQTAVRDFAEAEAMLRQEIREGLTTPLAEKAAEILDAVTQRTPREATVRRETGRLTEHQRQQAAAELGSIPAQAIARMQEVLAASRKQNIRELPAGQIREFASALKRIAAQNRKIKQLQAGRREREWSAVVVQSPAEVRARQWRPLTVAEAESLPSLPEGYVRRDNRYVFERRGKARESRAPDPTRVIDQKPKGLRRAGEFLDLMAWDGMQNHMTRTQLLAGRGGRTWEVLYENPLRGARRAEKLMRGVEDGFLGALKAEGVTGVDFHNETVGKTVRVDLANTTVDGKRVKSFELTGDEQLRLMAHLMRPSTRAELFRHAQNGLWIKRGDRGHTVKFSPEDLQSVVDSASPALKRFAERLVPMLGDGPLADAVAETYQRDTGNRLDREAHWNPRRRVDPGKPPDRFASMRDYRQGHLDNLPFLKPTAVNNAPILLDGFHEMFFRTAANMASYGGKWTPAQEALRLIHSKEFRDSVFDSQRGGQTDLKALEEAMQAYEGMPDRVPSIWDNVAREVLDISYVGGIGGKPHVVGYQGVSLLNLMLDMPAKHVLNAIVHGALFSRAARREMVANSDMLAERGRGTGLQVISALAGGQTEAAKLGVRPPMRLDKPVQSLATAREMSGNLAMAGIHEMDMGVMAVAHAGAKSWGIAQGLQGDALADFARRVSEAAVNERQPVWDALHTPRAVQAARKQPLARLIFGLMYTSQRGQNLNTLIRDFDHVRHGEMPVGTFLTHAATVTVVNAAMLQGVNLAWRAAIHGMLKAAGYDPDPWFDGWWDSVVRIGERMAGIWLNVGELGTELGHAAYYGATGDSRSWWMRERTNPVTDNMARAKDIVTAFARYITAEEDRWEGMEYVRGTKEDALDDLYIAMLRLLRAMKLPGDAAEPLVRPIVKHRKRERRERPPRPITIE